MTLNYLLVANPTARSGKARERIEFIKTQMTHRGMDMAFLATEPEGRTVESLRRFLNSRHFDIVIAMGGDGTFAEVAKGLLAADSGATMGLIPSGTANDQGRSFGISAADEDLDETIGTIQTGFRIKMDVGKIEALSEGSPVADNLFFDSAGFGMQPDILATRNRDRAVVSKIPLLREIYRDEAVYAGAVLREYARSWVEPTKFDATVRSGEELHEFQGLTDLMLNNTAVYAAAWVPAPDSEPDDGKIELCPMVGRRDLFSKMIRDLHVLPIWQEQLDVLGLQHSRGYSASHFDLRFRRSVPIRTQVDGEEWVEGNHFRVEVLPRALPLIIPKEFQPPWKQR